MIARIENGAARRRGRLPRRRWCSSRSSCCWPAWSAASSSTIRSCGATSSPRSCSCGSPCWARWWRCSACSICGSPPWSARLSAARRDHAEVLAVMVPALFLLLLLPIAIDYAADECVHRDARARPVEHRARRRDPGRRGADAGQLPAAARCACRLKSLLVVAAVLAVARGRAVARDAAAQGDRQLEPRLLLRRCCCRPACCWACRSASPSASRPSPS